MKKILILGNSAADIYDFRKELIEQLLEQGHEVFISIPDGDKLDLLQNLRCNFIATPIDRRGTNPVSDFKLLYNYLKILKKVNPDTVLTYTIKPNIYGSIACRLCNISYINNITGLGSAFIRTNLLTNLLILMYKTAFKKSKMVFFQNTTNLSYMLDRGTITGLYKLIPGSGVNLERFQYCPYPDETGAITFNFIGRVMQDKGIDDYLTAAKFIKQKYPETNFNIIGLIESDQLYYREIISEYEEEGYVKKLGYQKDIRPFIINSHCTVLPSYSEGMSNVLLESAAMGRVLIASDIPGCREIVENDVNGYTFVAGDADDLISKIEKFINLPHDRKSNMGTRSREKVEREFDRQIVIDSYLEEIHKILLIIETRG